MASYGRNLEFRIPPRGEARGARFVLTDDTLSTVPLGVPVKQSGVSDDFPGANEVELATGEQAPVTGLSGILVYEHAPAAFAGYDENLTTYSDLGYAPVGKLVQVVHDPDVKVLLRNTDDFTFLNVRDYDGRKMVAGLGGATPTVEVGEYLTPGTGDDTAGYWAVTTDATKAWLRVIAVDNDRQELEAQLLFH